VKTNFKTVATTAYKTSDGRLFEDEDDANKAQADIVGECVNGLFKLFGLDVSRNQEFRGCLAAMKHPDLFKEVDALYNALTFSKDNQP